MINVKDRSNVYRETSKIYRCARTNCQANEGAAESWYIRCC